MMKKLETVLCELDDEVLQMQFAELCQKGDIPALKKLAQDNGLQLFHDASSYGERSIKCQDPAAAVLVRNIVHQYDNTCEGVCIYHQTQYYELYR